MWVKELGLESEEAGAHTASKYRAPLPFTQVLKISNACQSETCLKLMRSVKLD